jgi:hypothetical protein
LIASNITTVKEACDAADKYEYKMKDRPPYLKLREEQQTDCDRSPFRLYFEDYPWRGEESRSLYLYRAPVKPKGAQETTERGRAQ